MRKVLFFTSSVLIMLFASCSKSSEECNPVLLDYQSEPEMTFSYSEEPTQLGGVIDIPYSVENLLKAWTNLPYETKSQIDTSLINPTHYYIRFYPKSTEELDVLRNIKPHVFLSEVPLDREVIKNGSGYHDPSISTDLPTFQYTVIPVERWESLQEDVKVETEILIKAYIPDYDEGYSTKSAAEYGIPEKAYSALLTEAYRMTGNESLLAPETKSGSWIPDGIIKAYDSAFNTYIPVPGVTVRGTHLLRVKETQTNDYGIFVLPSFNNPVSLKIVWESDDWDMRNGTVGQAVMDGPTLDNQTWQCNIPVSNVFNVRCAAIQRAAYRYFYGDRDGLLEPEPTEKVKISIYTDPTSTLSYFQHNSGLGIAPDIHINLVDENNDYRYIPDVFRTASHELGHAAHFANDKPLYRQCDTLVKEAFAIYVGWKLVDKEYYNGGVTGDYSYQKWPDNHGLNYCPILIDCEDNHNQHNDSANRPDDNVCGYSTSTLNSLLYECSAYSTIKSKLIASRPSTVSYTTLITLLDSYDEILQN